MISFSVRIHWVCVMETSLLKLHGDAWGSFGPCQNLNNSLRILVSVRSWFHPTPRAGLEFCIGRPHLTMVQLKIFWLWWYKSDMHSGETVLGILKLDLFLGLPTFMGKRLSCHAGQWQRAQLGVSHVIPRVNNWYTCSPSMPIQSFCISLSARGSINYMRHSTL